LIKQVWEEGKIPTDWRTGLVFPIHKKESEDICEKYSGITLLPRIYKLLLLFYTIEWLDMLR